MKKTLVVVMACNAFVAYAGAGAIETTGSGSLNLDAYRGQSIKVEFDSSPKLTVELQKRFEELGFKTAAAEPDVTIKVGAVFSFQKPRTREQQLNFGRVVEESDIDAAVQKEASNATRAPGVELGPLVQGLRGNLSADMILGVGLVDSILRMSGARGWFNKLVAGDERGICLGTEEMCKDWKKYTQRMRLGTLIVSKDGQRQVIRSEASTKSEELLPEQLFREGMGDLTNRLFPVSTPQETKPALEPEPLGVAPGAVATTPVGDAQ